MPAICTGMSRWLNEIMTFSSDSEDCFSLRVTSKFDGLFQLLKFWAELANSRRAGR
jgi:hypothetical protein